MLLTISIGLQAVALLLFFIPSAATPANELLTPPGPPSCFSSPLLPACGGRPWLLQGPSPESVPDPAGRRDWLLPIRRSLKVLAAQGASWTGLALGGFKFNVWWGAAAGPPEFRTPGSPVCSFKKPTAQSRAHCSDQT
jgi:hypothetical protein